MKKNILLFIAVLLLYSICSCSSKNLYLDDTTDDSPLTIYLLQYDDFMQNSIEHYNTLVKEGTILSRPVEIKEFTSEEYDSMFSKILNELTIGKGPDLIVIDNTFSCMVDLSKMIDQNTFANLDKLISNSETFSFDDYNKDALDTGIMSGHRYFMPISYQVPYMISTKENFDSIGLEIPAHLTYDDLYNISKSLNQDQYLELCEMRYIFHLYLSEQIDFNSKGYLKKNDTSKAISKQLQAEYIKMITANIPGGSWNDLIGTMVQNSVDNNEKQKLRIDKALAININTKHKNDAFKFIEYMLSQEVQGNSNYSVSIPVNLEAYNTLKQSLISGSFEVFNSDEPYQESQMPDELANHFIHIIESAEPSNDSLKNYYIIANILGENIDNYLDDKIFYEQMVDEINNRLSIYYTE